MESLFLTKLALPFLSTIVAAFTIMYINSINRRIKETKQKIYASTYILDSCMRTISSQLIILKHTIKPHIEVSYRIIEGDLDLLETMLVSDEFDILTEKGPNFSHIPNEFSLQLGYDNLELVQLYDTLLCFLRSDSSRQSLNSFVKENLKSNDDFLAKEESKKIDILNNYIDYLDRLEHEANRLIYMISYLVTPQLEEYISSYKFWLYSTKHAKKTIKTIQEIEEQYEALMPSLDYMERVKHGGIQNIINNRS